MSLHQFGWSITTIGGQRYDLPSRRGENLALAYKPGAMWRPKIPEQKTLSLSFFLTGMDPGTGDTTGDQILRWNDSWDFLRRLVWRIEGRQFTLTRRQRLTIGGVETLLVTEGLAELSGTMEPTMNGRTRCDFVMDLTMADPFFYGAEQRVQLPINAPVTHVNPGWDLAGPRHFMMQLNGPLVNPQIVNSTPRPMVIFKYNGTIPAMGQLYVDVENYTVLDYGSQTYVTGKVAFSGSRRWMDLLPGSNVVTLGADSGTGGASLVYRPPYL